MSNSQQQVSSTININEVSSHIEIREVPDAFMLHKLFTNKYEITNISWIGLEIEIPNTLFWFSIFCENRYYYEVLFLKKNNDKHNTSSILHSYEERYALKQIKNLSVLVDTIDKIIWKITFMTTSEINNVNTLRFTDEKTELFNTTELFNFLKSKNKYNLRLNLDEHVVVIETFKFNINIFIVCDKRYRYDVYVYNSDKFYDDSFKCTHFLETNGSCSERKAIYFYCYEKLESGIDMILDYIFKLRKSPLNLENLNLRQINYKKIIFLDV